MKPVKDKGTTSGSWSEGILAQWDDDLINPMRVQRETLSEILLKDAGDLSTLKGLGISATCSMEDFRLIHPITKYDYYEDRIQGVADGEMPATALVGATDELLGFAMTSGTSRGKSKLLPRTSVDQAARRKIFSVLSAIEERAGVPGSRGKLLTTMRKGKVITTPCGLPGGGGTTLGLLDPAYRSFMEAILVAPLEVCHIDDIRCALYAHMVTGLMKRDEVTSITSNFANQIVELFLQMKENWPRLVEHLKSGVALSPGLVNEESLSILAPIVGSGDPELAAAVEKEFLVGFEEIIPRLFPNCGKIACITTGTMVPYVPQLKLLAGDKLTIVSGLYGASEALVGVNTDPLGERWGSTPSYTIAPRSAYWEFIPLEELGGGVHSPPSCTKILQLDEVEIGQCYEVVLTTRCGLYRYRLQDVVLVIGFEHATPVVQFQYRTGAVLSIHSERMTEKMLLDALADAEADCLMQVKDFIVDIEVNILPPRYIFYCEPCEMPSVDELKAFAQKLDDSLRRANYVYDADRQGKLTGEVKIVIVDTGTFGKLAQSMLAKGTDPSHYKVPRCLKSENQRAIMQKSIITSSPGDQH
jgi:hypothetical protein